MVAPVLVPRSPEVLAEYREKADAGFWARRWERTDLDAYLARYRRGYLGYFDGVFRRHLPRDRAVLEGGCGRGQYVIALRRLGYDVHGVEYAEETVRALRRVEPGAPIHAADLRALPFPDGAFGAYISLGVVEHYEDGPGAILDEARRVLERDGVLLLSVPHYSPGLRRRMAGGARGAPAAGDFYQFYFSRKEIERRLAGFGFRPVDAFYYDAVYGAKRAFPRFLRLYEKNRPFRAVVSRLNRLAGPQLFFSRFSHMVMIVARKAERP